MAAQSQTQYGRSIDRPNEAWLAKQPPEPVIDPDLPIIDTHHHFWVRPDHRYLLDELLADLNTGHNILATVFLECRSMYRAAGPAEMRPVGETEFVNGIAAMSASGGYGPARVAAGIVGYADLTLGERVEPVLEAHIRAGGGRFRGVRHSAGWDADKRIGDSRPDMQPHLYARPEFRAGLARLAAMGLSLDAWLYHPQLGDVVDLARACPEATIIMGHTGGVLGYGALSWQARRGVRGVEGVDDRACPLPERLSEARRHDAAAGGVRLRRGGGAASVRRPWPAIGGPTWKPRSRSSAPPAALSRATSRWKRSAPAMQRLWNAFKRIAANASPDEKRDLFAGTARRAYRLD